MRGSIAKVVLKLCESLLELRSRVFWRFVQKDQFDWATFFPFTQRVECKFLFDPVDGVIGQFADVDERKDFYQKIEVARFDCHRCKRRPTNSLKFLGLALNQTGITGSHSGQSSSELAGPGLENNYFSSKVWDTLTYKLCKFGCLKK